MQADQGATRGTSPFLFFVPEKIYDANFLYAAQITYGTCSILRSISLIQVRQARAWKRITVEAIFKSGLYQLFTVSDPARDAGFRFECILTPTTRTSLLLSSMSSTKSTIYTTRGNQRWS